MRTLVRFTRTTYDDAEFTRINQGNLMDQAWFKQLEAELREQDFELPMELVKFEDNSASAMTSAGTVYLYVMVSNAPPTRELVDMLQHCYDEGASGFFEVIVEGLADKFETSAGFDSEKGRVTWSIVQPGGGDTVAFLDDAMTAEEQGVAARALCGELG